MCPLFWMISGGVVGLYLAASMVLFVRPTLLHRRKKLAFSARNIAHRGGAGERLENTLPAFRNAKCMGADMLELDVRLSKDGQVVVAHDADLHRLTGVSSSSIGSCNFEDLPEIKAELQAGESHFFKGGVRAMPGDDRHFALLSDVFKEFPNTPINLDCKDDSEELFVKVQGLIEENYRQHLTVWGSFAPKTVRRLRQLDNSVPTFASYTEIAKIVGAFWTGLLPFLPIKASCVELPLPSSILEMDAVRNSPLSFRIAVRAAAFLLARPWLFAHLRSRGIQVYFWVLNEERHWEEAMQMGASGIMTDRPSALQKWYHHYTRTTAADLPAHIHAP